eukprot:11356308-Prorocentrum_lima.AAC.1
MPAVLSGAKLTGRDSNVKAERMPGTASLMCKSNMEAEGELAIKKNRPCIPCMDERSRTRCGGLRGRKESVRKTGAWRAQGKGIIP